MKRIKVLLFLTVIATLLACSNKSLKDKAVERIKPATELAVIDPNSLFIQDIEPIITNDSLCLFSFIAKTKTESGVAVALEMEYFISRDIDENGNLKNTYHECAYATPTEEDKLLNKATNFKDGLESEGLNPMTVEDAAFTISCVYAFNKNYREVTFD